LHITSLRSHEGRSVEDVLVVLLALAVMLIIGLGLVILGLLVSRARPIELHSAQPQQRPAPRSQLYEVCPGCDARLRPWEQACPGCGLYQDDPLADQLRDLIVTRRVVTRLVANDRIADNIGASLKEVLLAERQRLLRGEQATPLQPIRVEAPAPVPAFEEEVLDALPVVEEAEPPPPPPRPIIPAAPPALPVPVVAVAPPPPRRPVTSVLAAFMEERNILWGELVGGLLIVGCSVALVLSLWRSLQQLPYFPVLLLGALTAALFGAGLYTLHRWKLQSTSRGLLVIALLLSPLNLLLLADPSARGTGPLPDWLHPVVAVVSVVLFAVLVRTAGRDLIGADLLPGPVDRRWLLAAAVVGTAGSQLATPALLADVKGVGAVPLLLGLAAIPGLCYLGSTGAVLAGLWRQVRRGGDLAAQQAHALFAFLGLAVFALLAALAFLMTRDPGAVEHLPALAMPLALAGVPGLAGGLFVHRLLRQQDSAGTRTAGTAVALGGLTLMLAGLCVAWPRPLPLFVVALLNGSVLTVAAYRGRAGFLHIGGLPCLALAVLLAAQLTPTGWVVPADESAGAWLATQLVSAPSALVLACFAAVVTPMCLGLGRDQALPFGLTACALAGLALVVATGHGMEQPLTATAVHVLVAAAAVLSSIRVARHALAHIGAWLLLPAGLWALHGLLPGQLAAWGTALSGEALLLIVAAALLGLRSSPLALACRTAGIATALTAALLAVFSGVFPTHPLHPATAACLAAAAFALAGQLRQPVCAALGSLLVQAGLVLLFAYQLPEGLPRPVPAALLVHATLAAVVCRCLTFRSNTIADVFVLPLRLSGQIGSMLAFALVLLPGAGMTWPALCALWASGLWLASAWRQRSSTWFTLFQAGLSVAALLGTRAVIDATGMFGDALAWLDPRVLHAYGIVLGALGLCWIGLREVRAVQALFPAVWAGLDRVVLAGLVLGQLLLAVVLACPGIAVEWSPGIRLADYPWWTAEALSAPAGWVCLAVLTGATAAGLWSAIRRNEQRLQIATCVGLCLLAAGAAVLWAGTHAGDRATASALRWGLAAVFVSGSAVVWLRGKVGVPALAGSSLPEPPEGGTPTAGPAGAAALLHIVLGLMATSVFLLSAVAAGQGFTGLSRGGPVEESLFARMGFTLSHLVPLALLVAGLAGNALRERSAGYAFVACQLALLSVAAGYALGLPQLDPAHVLFLCLLVVQTASVGTLGWLLARRRIPAGVLLCVQAWLGPLTLAVLAALPLCALLISPGRLLLPLDYHVLGRPGGWLALALATTTCFLHARRHNPRWQPAVLTLAILVAGALGGCLAMPLDVPGRWLSYHFVCQAWAGLGLIVVVAGSLVRREVLLRLAGGDARAVQRCLAVLGGVLFVAALRCLDDPALPWVAGGTALVASAVLAAPAVWFGRVGFAYPSSLAFCLVGVLVWLATGPITLPSFLLVVSLCLALAAAAWSLPRLAEDGLPLGQLATPIALAASTGAVALALVRDLAGAAVTLPGWLGFLALCAVGLALVVQRGRAVVRQEFYVLSLAALGLVLHGLPLLPGQIPWAAGLALALHIGTVALVLRCLPDESRREWGWLLPVQFITGSVVVLLGVWACLVPDPLIERLSGPLMFVLLVPAGWLLSRIEIGARQFGWIAPTALAGVLGALAWAVPAGHSPLAWLERDAWLLGVLAVTAVLYLEVRAGEGSPLAAVRRVGYVLFGLAVLAALLALGQMVLLFNPNPAVRRTPLSGPGIAAVLVALVLLVAAALRLALSRRPDPLGLGERGRMGYVYLAEVLLVLVFVHVRLNVPEVFTGWLARYWTLLVMGIAFIGVSIGEVLERRGLRVLAVPLQRTGLLLPLIPLLAFWARPPAALLEMAHDSAPGLVPFLTYLKNLPWDFDRYALLWFLDAGLFLMLGLSRRSRGWVLAAALAGNFGLWAILMHSGVAFLSHPQAWLIPLALILLVAEHVNREGLSAEVASALRYLGISLIYVASTADLFIAGVGNSLWLPVLLAVLCVAGVLAGIWLRVRAFLFLGMGFLLVDVGTMIWHAAVHQAHTWVWWASGIVLGVAILALFALFEKRRNDVLRLLDELRRWH
jgi:hypothetical protein